ncbi:MAG: nitroreductase family protein [candidate division WOR-3 bacterium]
MSSVKLAACRIAERASRRQGRPIPDEMLDRILEAARLAPSAKNIQPWKFIIVRDPIRIRELAQACNNQQFIAQAPVVICGCALEAVAYRGMGGYWNSWAVDLAIAIEHIVLAATAEGLGTCWIGSFQEAEVRRLLAIPEEVRIVALTPLGFPARVTPPRPRKALSEIVAPERWITPDR